MRVDYTELVDRFADKRLRNDAIIALVGVINARDLANITLKPEAKKVLIGGFSTRAPKYAGGVCN